MPTLSRSRTPSDLAEQAALSRIATLAHHVMIALRQPGRGVYESERQLRGFLTQDGYEFANDDLGPALTLLEATGRIGRSAAKKNVARRGWLITSVETSSDGSEGPADVEPTEAVAAVETAVAKAVDAAPEPVADSSEAQTFALAKAVIRALQTGNGRSNRCKVDELPERLAEDGVAFDPAEVDEVLTGLGDCGQIMRVQRQPYSVYAQVLVVNGRHPLDQTDLLAASVCSSVKRRGDRFESDDQLTSWLDEDNVRYDSGSLTAALRQLGESYDLGSLTAALRQLGEIGRIRRPVQEWGYPRRGFMSSPESLSNDH